MSSCLMNLVCKPVAGIRWRRAARMLKSGDFDEAERVLKRMLDACPEKKGGLAQLAEIATARKDWAEAVDRWERVLAANDACRSPASKQAIAKLAKACLARAGDLCKAGDLDGALAVLSVLLSRKPEHSGALLEAAEIYSVKQKWCEALPLYGKLLDAERRRSSRVLQGMAAALKASGKPDQALAVAKGAALCGLADSAFVGRLLESYASENKWEAAAEILANLVAIHPLAIANAPTARLAVKAFSKTGQAQNALTMLREAVPLAEKQGASFKSLAILKEIEQALHSNDVENADFSHHYYDDVYRVSPDYHAKGRESVYFPAWNEIVALIKANGYRRLLDVGCGPGQFAEYLLEEDPGMTYMGVDFSGMAIEAARRRCPNAGFAQADVFSDGALDGLEYDVVLMLEVLEHLHQDLELLKKLPSGSHVVASVPDFDAFGHVRFFSDSEQVKERYKGVMPDIAVKEIPLLKGARLFLLYGTTTR